MLVEQRITEKLTTAFTPHYLQVINESHMHSGPATESHFKVVIVADVFEGKRLLACHRLVNDTLKDELANDIHALAIHTYSPTKWQALANNGDSIPESPNCRGGSR